MNETDYYCPTYTVYHVTGVDVRGKRFKIVTGNYHHAMGINLWRGSVWEVRAGKRKLMKRTYN
ncbi:MAG: hypothetical protein ACXAB9_15345 [Candidatus Thorarchaeota archaeon]